MELYLIRHGKISVEPGKVCYGQTDLPPASSLETEARLLIDRISFQNALFYTSPLTRCTELTKRLTSKFETITDLKEVHCGHWEMKPWNDIPPDEFKKWETDIIHTPFPGGESYLEMFHRSTAFIEKLIKTHRATDQKLICVTHGGVIRAIISYFFKMDLNHSFVIRMEHAKFAKFTISDKMVICNGFNL